jgi:hypothetical protein
LALTIFIFKTNKKRKKRTNILLGLFAPYENRSSRSCSNYFVKNRVNSIAGEL